MAGEFGPASDRILPIQLREGLTVYVQDLPRNLTAPEAERIGRVIEAFAVKPSKPA